MKPFWHSIHWRIAVYYTLLMAGALALVLGFAVFSKKKDIERKVATELQARGIRLLPKTIGRRGPGGPGRPGAPPSGQRPPPEARGPHIEKSLEEEIQEAIQEGVFFLAVRRNGTVEARTDNTPEALDRIARTGHFRQMEVVPMNDYLVVSVITPPGDVLLLGTSKKVIAVELMRYVLVTGMVVLGVLASASFLGFLIIRHGLKPIEQISNTAQRIASGDLSGRIDVKSQRSELGKLAVVLNNTFDRLEEVLRRQVRFTADASHELRTPVAAILADCQFSLKRERPQERYLETIEVCHESAQHMRTLIDRLALLAKFDAQEAVLEREKVDLADVAFSTLKLAAPVAEQNGIELHTGLFPAAVEGDRLRLGQVILNLLNNAVRYNTPGGKVQLATGTDGKWAYIEVADTGIGIPEDKLERIFDRFYRVDSSRNDKTGGTGLGLAICRTIVEAHGGRISVTSAPGRGACFRVELPVSR